jgi:hypothetical protein
VGGTTILGAADAADAAGVAVAPIDLNDCANWPEFLNPGADDDAQRVEAAPKCDLLDVHNRM